MSKVTVAIPTYNRAHYLKEAIESVLNQTYTDYELLVVDNASTDNTEGVVKSFNDKRIKYVKNETNIGMVNNWNKCINLAQGEYLIIFHDDDIMKPELLKKEVEILDNVDEVVLVSTNATIINKYGKILKKIGKKSNNLILNKYDLIKKYSKDNFSLFFPTVMLKIDFINKNKIRFRNEIGLNADIHMWMEINLYDRKIVFLHEPLLFYRRHKEQGSSLDFFNRNIDGFKYTVKLLEKNKLEYNIPFLKRNTTYYLLSVLSYKLAYGNINRVDFDGYINKLKEEGLWIDNIKISYKVRLFLSYYCPKLAIILHKLKMIITNQKYY